MRNARSVRKQVESSPRTNQPAMAGAGGSAPKPDWRGSRGGRGRGRLVGEAGNTGVGSLRSSRRCRLPALVEPSD